MWNNWSTDTGTCHYSAESHDSSSHVRDPCPFGYDAGASHNLGSQLHRQGQRLLYVNCQPGMTLRDYVGRTVALYGPISYRSDDYLRAHLLTATHVAVP